jgi:serine/threonine-protein kinase RsbW
MEFLRQGALEANVPEERIGELELLVEELIINVSSHAYPDDKLGEVTVTYSAPAPGELSVEVADQGVEFNPLEIETPNLALTLEKRPIGGFGLHLVKTLAKSLTYRREQGWNRVTVCL